MCFLNFVENMFYYMFVNNIKPEWQKELTALLFVPI